MTQDVGLKDDSQSGFARAHGWAVSAFLGFEKSLNGAAKSKFHGIRKEAFSYFSDVGFPTPKNEDWKYTSVQPITRTDFALAKRTELNFDSIEPYLLSSNGPRLVFSNGLFVEQLSNVAQIPGVTVAAFDQLLSGKIEGRQFLERELGRHVQLERHPFSALNTSFVRDGVLVHAQAGVKVSEPIQIIFVGESLDGYSMNFPRILVVAEEHSQISLVETYLGLGKIVYLTNALTEIVVKENAIVDHYKLQLEAEDSFHVSTIECSVAQNAVFSTHSFSFGGALVRNEVRPTLIGSGVNCVMNGLTVLQKDQHVDNHTVLDNASPNCESRELYKGIYGDKSRGVFNGTIIVRPDAQKTNAVQSSNSILLSKEAQVNTKPQLKIWADDVKCTHGATVGQLDDDALFYIRSRGVKGAEAERMLIHAFASEVLTSVKIESLRALVEREISRKLMF